jgi:hypothetical protein
MFTLIRENILDFSFISFIDFWSQIVEETD